MRVGFARKDITPKLGCYLSGYYETRIADGIIDPLLGTAIAATDENQTVIIMSLDMIGINQQDQDIIRRFVSRKVKVPYEAIMIACTHTHLGPAMSRDEDGFKQEDFSELKERLAVLAQEALEDMRSAEMYCAETHVHDVSFVRIFKMNDGSLITNPGLRNPNVNSPIHEPDEHLGLVLFKRKNASEIAIINFQVHPDVIGGTKISADYPKHVRDTFEKTIENSRCMYINGTCGDLNHIDIRLDDDDLVGGYQRSVHMGRCIASAAVSVYATAKKCQGQTVGCVQRDYFAALNKGTDEEIIEAKNIYSIWKSGRENEIFSEEELNSMAHNCAKGRAEQIVKLISYPSDRFPLHLNAISIGDLGVAGFPAEPFSAIGKTIREKSEFPCTFSACCCNGYENSYLPTEDVYGSNAYEPNASMFLKGEAEKIAEEMLTLLNGLKCGARETNKT